jgi:hypothetical protein
MSCKRCGHDDFINENRLCETCDELIKLRETLKKYKPENSDEQHQIRQLEQRVKQLEETILAIQDHQRAMEIKNCIERGCLEGSVRGTRVEVNNAKGR